jgi:hypothetical protein
MNGQAGDVTQQKEHDRTSERIKVMRVAGRLVEDHQLVVPIAIDDRLCIRAPDASVERELGGRGRRDRAQRIVVRR